LIEISVWVAATSTTTCKEKNSGDKAAVNKHCMLLSDTHEVLSHGRVTVPWMTLSSLGGIGPLPNPLEECTSCTRWPGEHREELKTHTLALSSTATADAFAAGASCHIVSTIPAGACEAPPNDVTKVFSVDRVPEGALQTTELSDVHLESTQQEPPRVVLKDEEWCPNPAPVTPTRTEPVQGMLPRDLEVDVSTCLNSNSVELIADDKTETISNDDLRTKSAGNTLVKILESPTQAVETAEDMAARNRARELKLDEPNPAPVSDTTGADVMGKCSGRDTTAIWAG
jgi:hypothetical protein